MRNNLIITYAIFLQYITVIFLLFSPTPIRVASLGVFYDLFLVPQVGGVLMLLGVVLATFGVFMHRHFRFRFLFFIVQYIFVLLIAGSSVNYIIQGMYADGVIRPWQFIFVDQLPYLILAALYPFDIFDFRKRKSDKGQTIVV